MVIKSNCSGYCATKFQHILSIEGWHWKREQDNFIHVLGVEDWAQLHMRVFIYLEFGPYVVTVIKNS